jgi:hypothetical protein
MRRLLTFAMLAVALALPAGTSARPNGLNDGTLSVRDGRGKIVIQGRGGVIGSFVQGSVTISDPIDGDGTGPIVTGEDFPPVEKNENTTTWRGSRVRFRIIGGTFRIVVRGRGINLSFVGKANVTLDGSDTAADTGVYATNGAEYSAIPDFAFPFVLSATSP